MLVQGVLFMAERKTGLDMIRCIALMLVVTFHSFLFNGYFFEQQKGLWMLLAGSVRWLSTGCIGLFLMLTGYLKSGELGFGKCWRGIPRVIVTYIIAAVITIPVRHFVLGDRQSLWTWCVRFITFQGVYYGWYVEMYLGLMLLAPFINRMLAGLNRSAWLLLCAVMLILTAIPGIIKVMPDYWRSIYPVTYYILGALVRQRNIKLAPALGLPAAVGIAGILGAVTVLSTDSAMENAAIWEFPDLWILLISVFLFVSLHHLKTGGALGKLLRFGAGGCLGGYLLSHLADATFYQLAEKWHSPEQYWKLFLCITVPIFVMSVSCGFVLERLAGALTGRRRHP